MGTKSNSPESEPKEGKHSMPTSSTVSAATTAPVTSADHWTKYNATVLAICILGWAFDIYEASIMQLITPLLIKEWGITPATMGMVTTVSRWIGLIGTFAFPVFADLYGRKPALIWAILGYSLFTGLTGFSTGWISLLIFSSITRIALAGENPGRHADGHRNRADQMARDGVGRPRRRLPFGLHAVLAGGARRSAIMGMALVVFPRHRAGAARAVDPDRHQGKPALRARYCTDVEGGAEEAVSTSLHLRGSTRAKC